MPWSASDAKSHNKSCDTPKKQSIWAKVANETLERELKNGTKQEEAEGIAVRTANSAVADLKESVEVLHEYASCRGATLTVNREAGVIPGVKILGLVSANNRVYTAECAAKAIPMYEGAAVYVDHSKRGERRSYRDRIGHLAGIVASADGLYGDLHYNPKHSLAEQLAWDAEHAPANVGLSHVAEGTVVQRGGKDVVECIHKIESVDLVTSPATTHGLFEDEAPPADPEARELAEHGLSAASDARRILLGDDDIAKKKTRLLEVLATWQAELAGDVQKESHVEYQDLTAESLREHRADLVEILAGAEERGKLTAEIQALKEAVVAKDAELAALKAREAEQAKLAEIAEELRVAKLDPSNATVVSVAFMGQLKAAPDKEARKSLLEDRMALLKLVPVVAAPFASIGAAEGVGPGKDAAETLGRLR